jgi:hypothetical protein
MPNHCTAFARYSHCCCASRLATPTGWCCSRPAETAHLTRPTHPHQTRCTPTHSHPTPHISPHPTRTPTRPPSLTAHSSEGALGPRFGLFDQVWWLGLGPLRQPGQFRRNKLPAGAAGPLPFASPHYLDISLTPRNPPAVQGLGKLPLAEPPCLDPHHPRHFPIGDWV